MNIKQRKKILIVTQDIFLIQTYSGVAGTIVKKIYLFVLGFRLKLLLFFLSRNNVTVLTSDLFTQNSNNQKFKSYSDEIAKIDIAKYRIKSLNLVDKLSQLISQLCKQSNKNLVINSIECLEVWRNQLAARASYYLFPYMEVIKKKIKEEKSDKVIILGKSRQEMIAQKTAIDLKINFNYFWFLDLSILHNFLEKHLVFRLFKNKQKNFINNSGKNKLKGAFQQCKNSFLLSADFFRHLKILVPIYNKFKQKKERIVFVIDSSGSSTALKKIYQIKKDRFNFSSILETDYIKRKLKTERKFFNYVYKKIYSNWKINHELKFMRSFIEPLIKEGLPLAVLYLIGAKQIIEKLNPKGVICHNDMRPAEKSLLIMSEKHKIKTMIIHSEIFSADKVNEFKCTYFSAIGKHVRSELIKIGYSKEKIYVNGDPRLDFLRNRIKPAKSETYRKIGINEVKKIVLLISDRTNPLFSYEEKKEQFVNVSKTVAGLPEVQLIIKPHPTEDRKLLIKDLKDWRITNAIVTNNATIELFELLDIVSVVIIAWSMVGFEAMLFKIPVIVANFSAKNYDLLIPYVKRKGAVKAGDIEVLEHYIKIFANKESKTRNEQIENGLKFCGYYYRLPLGKASDRIYRLIIKNS